MRIVFGTPILDFHATPEGSGRVQMTEHCVWNDGDTAMTLGTYYDRYRWSDGRWRFAWRLFAMDYRGPPDLTGAWLHTPDYGPPPAMPPWDAMSAAIKGPGGTPL